MIFSLEVIKFMDDLLYVLILGLIWLVVVVWGVCAETKDILYPFRKKRKIAQTRECNKKAE